MMEDQYKRFAVGILSTLLSLAACTTPPMDNSSAAPDMLSPQTQEPALVVQVSSWPTEAVGLRVLTTLAGKPGQTLEIAPGQGAFTVFIPPGTTGSVSLEGIFKDAAGCNTAGWSTLAVFTGQEVAETITVTPAPQPYIQKQCPRVCSADGWCYENPKPNGGFLRGVWGDRADNGWAVGNGGVVWR